MKMRTLQENGKTFVLLPMREYERLMERLEDEADVAVYRTAKAKKEEAFPIRLFDEIAGGAPPVRVFRTYRRMTGKALARAAGISEAYLSQIESGKRKGSARVMKTIAKALRVDMAELVTDNYSHAR